MATIGGSIWGRFGFSDVLTVFLAMDSYVELYKGGIVSMADFVSMKMDNDMTAPCDGVISFKAAVGSNVETGDVMAVIA